MFGFLRSGAIASAFITFSVFAATPAVAAQEQVAAPAPAPVKFSLPAAPAPVKAVSEAPAAQPSTALPPPVKLAPPVQAPVKVAPSLQPPVSVAPKNPFASLPAVVRQIAPALPVAKFQQPPKSLHDLVAAYVNYGTKDAQQECLARAIYFEARSEPLEGQLAVADVVLNRAASGKYPPTICEVVTQPWQFSFIQRGQFPEPNKNSKAWHDAVALSEIAQKKLAKVVPPNVLWYHANYVSPSWGRRLNRVAQIGLHIFYS